MGPRRGRRFGLGVSIPFPILPDRWERVDLPMEAGFPPYRKPYRETFAFRLITAAVEIALVAIIIN